ncbi:MAG: hypothetical protein ACQ5SW_10350 [Sphaerochaetaceae bacterium]
MKDDKFKMVFSDRESMYEIVTGWQVAHGWTKMPIDVFPPIGAFGVWEDRLACAVFAYECQGTSIAWMDWMVTNPEIGIRAASAMKRLCQAFSDYLIGKGATNVVTCCRQESLGRVLHKSGFDKTDENVTHYVKTGGKK